MAAAAAIAAAIIVAVAVVSASAIARTDAVVVVLLFAAVQVISLNMPKRQRSSWCTGSSATRLRRFDCSGFWRGS